MVKSVKLRCAVNVVHVAVAWSASPAGTTVHVKNAIHGAVLVGVAIAENSGRQLVAPSLNSVEG